jgi:hypothetical protein
MDATPVLVEAGVDELLLEACNRVGASTQSGKTTATRSISGDVDLQKDMELLGQKHSLVRLSHLARTKIFCAAELPLRFALVSNL